MNRSDSALREDYELGQQLPAEVQTARGAGWHGYRNFPVFSRPWLRGRTRIFALCISAFAAISGISIALVKRDPWVGVYVAAINLCAFLAMATIGPAAATWVRSRRWPKPREQRAVVVAIVLGMLASGAVDALGSDYGNRIVGEHPTQSFDQVFAEASSGARVAARAINLVFRAAVYGLLGGALAVPAYFSERRRVRAWRAERRLAAAEDAAREADLRYGILQAQVEPHFLFNTLASIRAVLRRDPERAERTIDALVAHLRATIPKLRGADPALTSTLGQQLDICAGYLEVMQLRTDGRLGYRIHAEDALRALPYPPLLLITLVENAIKHGIEPKPGNGVIEIEARIDATALVVSVRDDGVGLRAGTGSGIGLANVRAQLDARFGGAASLALTARAEGGALARISTPLEGVA